MPSGKSATHRHKAHSPKSANQSGDAEPQSRSTVWHGHISFGLVSFPVRLFAAARPEAVHFHLLHRSDLSRVKEVWYCAEEDKPISRSEMAKGYEASKGEYVLVDDKELKKIEPATATTIDILQFVGNEEVDPIFFERSYYVGADDKTTKACALFVAALAETKQSAIAKVAMHGREHVVLIRSSGDSLLLHTMFYPNELHSAKKGTPPKAAFTAKELTLAKSLIDHLSMPFKPETFTDTYRESVERLIEQKQKGQPITAPKHPRKAPVFDLMEALKRSLKSAPPNPVANRTPRAASSRTGSGRHKAA